MNIRASLKRLAIVVIWLAIWQLVALVVNNAILLAGPLEVLGTLARDVMTLDFWSSIGFSLVRIVLGFLAAFILGVSVGVLAGRLTVLKDFLEPALQFVKSVPIVCIIVLLLLWFGSPFVSAIAVFLVAFPAIYFAVLQALRERNQKLRQMLKLFKVTTMRRVLAYSWPSILPFLISTSRVAVGMSWKAGVAAELIGLPLGSIGENIYQAKLTFSSAELFSWTIVIVLISLLCEKLFLALLKKSESWAWRLALPRYRQDHSVDSPDSLHSELTTQSTQSQEAALSLVPGEIAVSLEKVSVVFGEQHVIRDLSLELRIGQRYALRGISGSGKTTLLSVMEGLILPSSGTVRLFAEPSAVFQDTRLFEQHSARENVQLIAGHSVSREHIDQILEELLPADALDKPVKELSGGMRRRVELARALVFPSELLLLDEPFAGLDDESKVRAQTLIQRELGKRTLVLATHDHSDEIALDLESIIIHEAT